MTPEEYAAVMEVIRGQQHIEYGNNYAPKMVIDSNGVHRIEIELRKFVRGKKRCNWKK